MDALRADRLHCYGYPLETSPRIDELAEQGTAVLLISSDLPELVGLSDRAVVMRNGRLIGDMQKEELSEGALLLAANGQGGLSDV